MQAHRKPATDHIGYLDSVRGIAALMVLFYHYIGWHWQNTEVHLASIVFNGADAVSFFFVLSGFVLSYKYLVLNHSLDIRKFYINRVFRLLPAYALIVALEALYWFRHELNGQTLADLFIYNKHEVFEELFLLRGRSKFYGAGWTLVVELLISFFVPFAILIARQGRKLLIALIVCFLLEGHIFASHFHIHFCLGVLLASCYYELSSGDIKNTKWYRYRYLIIPAAFLLYSIRHIERIFPMGPTGSYLLSYLNLDFFLFTGFASFIILGAIISSSRAQRFLDRGVWRFYGRISYGIYLVHWLVVSAIFDYWQRIWPVFGSEKKAFFIMMAACLAVSTLLALAIHYVVELPFLRFGKRFVHKLKPSVVIAPQVAEDNEAAKASGGN